METVSHKIVKSEIKYGILNMRMTDGTKSLFENLPERFSINLRGHIIPNRKIKARRVWVGFTQMKNFQPNETVKLSKQENIIYVE